MAAQRRWPTSHGTGYVHSESLVRCPETFTGSSRAQTTPRGVAALAKTPGMSFGRRLARRRLDPAITPATFLDTALGRRFGPCRGREPGNLRTDAAPVAGGVMLVKIRR